MGRGRAKAKQTKVARQLKYTTTGTDLDRLRAELASDDAPVSHTSAAAEESDDADDADDPYAAYADDDDDEAGEEAHRAG
jgi:hypothetical protein